MSRILDVALDVSYLTGETDYILVHAREGQHDGEGRECVEPVVGVLVREWQLRAADALRVEQQVALGVLHGLRHPLVEERRRGGAGLGHGAQEREKKKEEKKVTTIMTTRCFYTVWLRQRRSGVSELSDQTHTVKYY
jgi:hypothetical protein